MYDEELDAFCWQVQVEPKPITGSGEYPVNNYYINGTTGKFVTMEETSVYYVQSE